MLEAACDGIAGTLCTLHARSSHQTFEKLVNYARRDGAAYDRADVLQTAAFALDLIVYLDMTPDGRRVVSEITQVLDYDAARPPDHHQRLVRPRALTATPCATRGCPIPVDMLDLPARARLRAGAAPRRSGLVTGLALLCGLLVVGGGLLAPPGCASVPPERAGADPPHRRDADAASGWRRSAAAALVALVLTRWPVAAVGAGLAVACCRVALGARPPHRRGRHRRGPDRLGRDAARRHGHPRGIEGVLVGHRRRAPRR